VNYAFDGPAKIAANKTHIFCVDGTDLHIIDEKFELIQKIQSLDFKTVISISCSADGSVTIFTSQNTIICFTQYPDGLKYF
jgi:hypothetical protein